MKKICAVRDRAVDSFDQPFFVLTAMQAIRIFSDEVNRRESQMNAHPEDYDLYVLGTYNDQDGSVVGETPHMLTSGKEVFKGSDNLPF